MRMNRKKMGTIGKFSLSHGGGLERCKEGSDASLPILLSLEGEFIARLKHGVVVGVLAHEGF